MLFRSVARSTILGASRASSTPALARLPYSTTGAFRGTGVKMVENKDADPTPDKGRAGSEQSMPGADGDQIADSDAAYDSDKPRPDQSADKMEKEKPVNMNKSAASSEPANNATNGQGRKTSSAGEGSNPAPSGGSSVRGGKS